MIRFWFEFENNNSLPIETQLGVGVTAKSYSDALTLVKENVFRLSEIPRVKNFIENIDISVLDEDHVIPNMGVTSNRGIWYPLGYH